MFDCYDILSHNYDLVSHSFDSYNCFFYLNFEIDNHNDKSKLSNILSHKKKVKILTY